MIDLIKLSLGILFSKLESKYLRSLIINFNDKSITEEEVLLKLKNNNYKKSDLKIALVIMFKLTNNTNFKVFYNKKFLTFDNNYSSIYTSKCFNYFKASKYNQEYLLTVDLNKINTLKELNKQLEEFKFILNYKLRGLFNICTSNDNVNHYKVQESLFNFLLFNLEDITTSKLSNNNLTKNYKFLSLKLNLKPNQNKIQEFKLQGIKFYILQYLTFDSLSNILICKKEDLLKLSSLLQEEKKERYTNKEVRILERVKKQNCNIYSSRKTLETILLEEEDLKSFYSSLKIHNLKQYKNLLKKIHNNKYYIDLDKEEAYLKDLKDLEEVKSKINNLDKIYNREDISNFVKKEVLMKQYYIVNENLENLQERIETYKIQLDKFTSSNTYYEEETELKDYFEEDLL